MNRHHQTSDDHAYNAIGRKHIRGDGSLLGSHHLAKRQPTVEVPTLADGFSLSFPFLATNQGLSVTALSLTATSTKPVGLALRNKNRGYADDRLQ